MPRTEPAIDAEIVARLRSVLSRLSRQLNRSAALEGLTPSQASALGLIAYRGPISIAEVTSLEGVNPTMMSRMVGYLDRRGLITRNQNPDDMRAGLVEATDDGHAMNERIRSQRAAVVAECLAGMPSSQQQLIIAALPALDALEAALAAR